jgi:hypothetical protein
VATPGLDADNVVEHITKENLNLILIHLSVTEIMRVELLTELLTYVHFTSISFLKITPQNQERQILY